MTRYDLFQLRLCAHTALLRPERSRSSGSAPDRSLVKWFVDHAGRLGCGPLPTLDLGDLEIGIGEVEGRTWIALKPVVEALTAGRRVPPPSSLERRLAWLCRTLALPPLDGAILKLAVRSALFRPFQSLAALAGESHSGRDEINVAGLAALTAHPLERVRQRLKTVCPLRLLGLLEDRKGGDYAPSGTVLQIARLSASGDEALRAALLGRFAPAHLQWDDFAHLGEIRDLAEALVGAALARRSRGINLLVHGAPGTGKTEFARTLAERLAARACFVGEADELDAEPNRRDRVAAFAVARALAARAGRMLLVVDEADDIFTGVDEDDAGKRRGSKVFMNRLVETTEAPTVWITNHPERLGPAVMRRMALAVRLPEPGRERRRIMIGRIAAQRGLALPPRDLDGLADIEAAPAILDSGLRVAKLTRGGARAAALSARSIQQTLLGRVSLTPRKPALFDPALSAADIDLAHLADRVAACPGRALSFCFHGLPGTGKSAYARYLASRLGVDVIERKASDLLSMWVGGTEQAIAAAFAEAAERGAMLVLDEADSLLRDRADARASWEVSQVNEMLTHMEAAQHPFACTTNLMESLDPATLRRFLFKVEFRPMTADQARHAFETRFGDPAPAGLSDLEPLAPGDFAVVARKASVLGVADPAGLLALLSAEVAVKPQAGRARIGFCP
ncbi:AAA family ATPase [Methylobacterium sp. WL8]|uniref:AAA family ATPase n=1 Tax=Methylobacterium sp. WL8 TaxID=2603899 RepID=UPI0011C826A2|nr:AAA family ATPase [Methylobacterium sp. WL8]TXN82696.1 AAA family ATPase [Methylobacterium sp. WL8]